MGSEYLFGTEKYLNLVIVNWLEIGDNLSDYHFSDEVFGRVFPDNTQLIEGNLFKLNAGL